jgi:hypothetical protein
MKEYTLPELRSGTGFKRGVTFVASKEVEGLRAAALALLERASNMTTNEFQSGADRPERRKLAVALGLNPGDYSL